MHALIVVEEYNPKWPEIFRQIKDVLLRSISDDIIDIVHVGSTSVPGLMAKPKIDMDIIIKNDDDLSAVVIEKLAKLGYKHVGDLGITGREAFKRNDTNVPYDGTDREWMPHNLYLCTENSIGLRNHISLRDYLRKHPEKVKEYGQLKCELSKKFPYDIDAYVDGKTSFIVDILAKTGIEQDNLDLIDRENRLK